MTRFFAAVLALVCPFFSAAAADKSPRPVTVVVVGGSGGDETTPTLIQLEHRLRALDPADAVVIFTGSYSARALPPEDAPGRAKTERELLAHVDATADFVRRGGRVYFLPGDRDFPDGGTRAVRRLRKFLNRAFEHATGEQKLEVMPQADCASPRRIELTKKVGLLLVNSQWWMQDPKVDSELSEECEVKTRARFTDDVRDVLRDYRDRRLIIASHHPLASYGEHGGAFGLRAHLTPLPVVGSFRVFARQSGLVPQDQNHPVFYDYLDRMHDEAETTGGYVFASGHDANLQLLAFDRQTQIISGTSANTAAPTVGPREGEFAVASPGWVELAIDAEGEGEVRAFGPDATPLFRAPLPPVQNLSPIVRTWTPPMLPQGPVEAGYSTRPVWQLPSFATLFTGTYYSDAFTLRLPYEVLDLQTEQGGLRPYRIGGGAQTNSIRARDPAGGDWAIRSTTKDSSRLAPYPYNGITPLRRALDYAFTGTHPEAALAVPRLAEAIGVPHLTPRLMYLPDQEALGHYRGFIGDEVVMVEQRPHKGLLPGTTRFRDHEETVADLLEDPSFTRVDQEAMLRARLLDVLVGDWDRSRGQWRFAVTPSPDGAQIYTPIPLDRDQAMAHYDGAALMLGRLLIPQARSLQPFTGSYGRVGWLVHGGRNVDAVTLNRLPHDRWMEIAKSTQAALTDAVIDEAMSTWHPEATAQHGARIAAALKERRDGLTEAADAYYRLISQNVDVTGSKYADVFDVGFLPGGAVRVTARPRELGAAPFFDRVFFPSETDEVRLYALESDDVLRVHGSPHGRIGIRFIGGQGKDKVLALGGPLQARAIAVYDSPTGLQIEPSIDVRDERTTIARFNTYDDRADHEPDFGYFTPGLRLASDELAYVGGTFTYVVQGFKKEPYAASHGLSGYVAIQTLGGALDYAGHFPESLGLLDQQVDLSLRTPTHTRNFFGITNTFVDDAAESPDFYRVRQARYEGRYGLAQAFNDERARIGAQVLAQAIVTEDTPGRFVSTSPDAADAIGARYFAGGRLFAEINTYDSLTVPRRGLALFGSLEGRADLQGGSPFSMTHRLGAAAAIPFDRDRRVVLMTRAVLEGIVGDSPFYFAPTLGRSQLRAYREEQLAGDLAFAHTSDLRIDVFRIQSVLPGTIGVNLSADHGRVWGKSIASNDYHLNLGGGAWWSIVDTFGLSIGYHRGLDGGSQLSFSLGNLFANTGF